MDTLLSKREQAVFGASMTASTKRKPTSLPNETVEYLKAWIMSPEHIAHPYPTEAEKAKIMEDTGIEMKQLTNWFVNNRKRFWKPRVEARMREHTLRNKVAPKDAAAPPSSPPKQKSTTDASSLSLESITKAAVVSPMRTGVAASTASSSSSKSTQFPLLRTISEHNSVVSLSDLGASDDDESVFTAIIAATSTRATEPKEDMHKTESIHVHILRPTDGSVTPSVADVTISRTVPAERILRTFQNCSITYNCGNNDGAKMQSRRDVEVARAKTNYLAVYLAEVAAMNAGASSSSSPTSSSSSSSSWISGQKRSSVHVVAPDEPMNSRPKYRRMSVDLWKEACQTANHVYDQELPSLEEATQLFGYTSS